MSDLFEHLFSRVCELRGMHMAAILYASICCSILLAQPCQQIIYKPVSVSAQGSVMLCFGCTVPGDMLLSRVHHLYSTHNNNNDN